MIMLNKNKKRHTNKFTVINIIKCLDKTSFILQMRRWNLLLTPGQIKATIRVYEIT